MNELKSEQQVNCCTEQEGIVSTINWVSEVPSDLQYELRQNKTEVTQENKDISQTIQDLVDLRTTCYHQNRDFS